eukprot:CAMPEP_0118896584 /NCGR_PEP_ID=MMETSP1166-20130328/4381_1 /TAXON_ID=1104430 /ORGANISM="Chrysoreinhardia sp, Strain CCMP3193" /LENGTH=169 /DNA_ID=CAMNT_0006835643 /DNA_START=50 /DNA_END=559 /DNA_ORIENTATION=-
MVLLALTGASAFVSPLRCCRRRAAETSLRSEATEAITAGVEAFRVATTNAEALEAMSRIAEAIPKGETFDFADPIPSAFKVDAFRALDAKKDLLSTTESLDLFRTLRIDLDPLRTTDLRAYLSVAGIVGGLLYGGALAVQWFLPEIFPAVYVFLALVFFAPFFVTFFLA